MLVISLSSFIMTSPLITSSCCIQLGPERAVHCTVYCAMEELLEPDTLFISYTGYPLIHITSSSWTQLCISWHCVLCYGGATWIWQAAHFIYHLFITTHYVLIAMRFIYGTVTGYFLVRLYTARVTWQSHLLIWVGDAGNLSFFLYYDTAPHHIFFFAHS